MAMEGAYANYESEALRKQRDMNRPIQCFDSNGNPVKIYREIAQASAELNIPPGDIYMCCKGTKNITNGYKFKFHVPTTVPGEETALPDDQSSYYLDPNKRLKRGYTLELIQDDSRPEVATRSTRASRGEYAPGDQAKDSSNFAGLLRVTKVPCRQWRREQVRVGNIFVPRWLPNKETTTSEIQAAKPKSDPKKRRNMRRQVKGKSVLGTKSYDPFFSAAPEE